MERNLISQFRNWFLNCVRSNNVLSDFFLSFNIRKNSIFFRTNCHSAEITGVIHYRHFPYELVAWKIIAKTHVFFIFVGILSAYALSEHFFKVFNLT